MQSLLAQLLPYAVILLLLISAVLAASETALFALVRMEHTRGTLSGPVRQALDRLMRRPLESLIIVLGLNGAANICAECLATSMLLFWLGPVGAWLSVPLMFVLVLLFADITPKTLALGFPAQVAQITARPLAAIAGVVHPVTRIFTPAEQIPAPEAVSESEFKVLLRLGESQGQVEPAEREMIHKVFDFGSRRVFEVMTSRDRIFSLDIDTPADRLVAQVAQGHFSRVPVYRHRPDNIVGVLHVKDLVARRLEPGLPRLERLVRPAYFVPTRKPLTELFDEMRRHRIQLALVVDEYGKLQGLVTLEDLLEELFGEIRDEFDVEGPELSKVADNEWIASGSIELRKLKEAIGFEDNLPAGEQTLSSHVLRALKRVPRPGDKFRIGDLEGSVERVRGATVELVRLTR